MGIMTSLRQGDVHRVTAETDVLVRVGLHGCGQCNVSTGVAFLDHMLHQLSSHGLLDLEITATGDTHIGAIGRDSWAAAVVDGR